MWYLLAHQAVNKRFILQVILIFKRLLPMYQSEMKKDAEAVVRGGNGEQDGGRVTQPRSVCSDQGNLPVLRQLSRGSELPSAVALRGKQCSGILETLC
ncbi:hypothetical protein NDU88_006434 [Pleurodeles waltl]|uniref:Uncharacterized protein n=1 Tax=Pleurodeles waltl TaxID=8319 RepID=A0AAV7UQ05_PLEWA|nr:hypothetical protein NDU88_006434 [Pleurodeles waltl]